MERRTTSWYSPNLNMEMPLVAYGHAGQTLLMLPTAAADYLEYERFYLVDAIKPFIEARRIRAYSINSVNRYSLLNEQMPPHLKAESISILSGQGSYEDPKRSQQLSDIVRGKGIPPTLDLWGSDVNHDWPWWRKMLPHVLGKIVAG